MFLRETSPAVLSRFSLGAFPFRLYGWVNHGCLNSGIQQLVLPALILFFLGPILIWRLRVAHHNRFHFSAHWTLHPWISFSYTPQPRYCSHCRELISGFLLFRNMGYQCQICGIFSHISCVRGSDRLPCKFPAREWPIQHQIRQGNLQNNSVCGFCGVVCSSSFSLFGLECLWCHRTYHGACLDQALELGHDEATRCDLGSLAMLILPPSAVVRRLSVPKHLPPTPLASPFPPSPPVSRRSNSAPVAAAQSSQSSHVFSHGSARRRRSAALLAANLHSSKIDPSSDKLGSGPKREPVARRLISGKLATTPALLSAREPGQWHLRGEQQHSAHDLVEIIKSYIAAVELGEVQAAISPPSSISTKVDLNKPEDDAPSTPLASKPHLLHEPVPLSFGVKLSSFVLGRGKAIIPGPPPPNLSPQKLHEIFCDSVYKLHKIVCELLFELERFNSHPIVAFVNPKSGGQLGHTLVKDFFSMLNPWQVVSLTDDSNPREALRRFKALAITGHLRVLVCGGDGTVSWIVEEVTQEFKGCPSFISLVELLILCRPYQRGVSKSSTDRSSLCAAMASFRMVEAQVPIAILPLGTGNDLARILHWGATFDGGDLRSFLKRLVFAKPVALDLWTIEGFQAETAQRLGAPLTFGKRKKLFEGGSSPSASKVHQGLKRIFTKTFTNYVDIGIAARIALKFHVLREAHPELFRSRLGNKFLYGEVGVRDFLVDQPIDLIDTEIYCDGDKVELEHLRLEGGIEGLAIVNIPSFAGGCSPWKLPVFRRQRSNLSQARATRGTSLLSDDGGNGLNYASAASRSSSPATCGSLPARPNVLKEIDLALRSTDLGQPRKFVPQKFSDQRIELIAFKSLLHLGQVQVGMAEAVKLAQGRELRFVVKTSVPCQIDGEPEQLAPCELRISWKSKASMLSFHLPKLKHNRLPQGLYGALSDLNQRRRTTVPYQSRLISQERFQEILHEAVYANDLTAQQAHALLQRFLASSGAANS